MKYDLSQTIKNHRGVEIKDTDPATKKPVAVVMADILANACLATQEGKTDFKEKTARFKLAKKCNPYVTDFSMDEIEQLRKCVNEAYPSPLLCGAVDAFFETPWVAPEPVVNEAKAVDNHA